MFQESSVFSSSGSDDDIFNQLIQLLAEESFMNSSHRESIKSYSIDVVCAK
jgi:hypothetical protein